MPCGYVLPTFLSFIWVVIGGGRTIKEARYAVATARPTSIFSVHTTRRRVAAELSVAVFATSRRHREKKGTDLGASTHGSASTVLEPDDGRLGAVDGTGDRSSGGKNGRTAYARLYLDGSTVLG